MNPRLLAISLVLALPTALDAQPPSLADYHGEWEIVLVNSGATFRSCAIDLKERDGAPYAEVVWKWGSVERVRGPDAIWVGDDGALRIAKPGWSEPLVLRLVGSALEGRLELGDGKEEILFGRRACWDVGASGVWKIEAGEDGEARGTLSLWTEGLGRYSGAAWDGEGRSVKVRDVRVEGNQLRVDAVARGEDGSEGILRLIAEIRGDRLEGKIVPENGGESVPAKGSRERRWGEPVRLLAERGLRGWRPRDPSQKFGWTCDGGVLTNSPPDSDIVSEAEFQDFKLTLEYKVERPEGQRSNSGIYLRGRYEVQIVDDYEEDPAKRRARPHGNGSIYSRLAPARNATGAPGEWQKYEITLIDRYVTVALNGRTLIDNEKLEGITGGALLPFESEPGPLMLQGDHGKIWYRDIVVVPALPASPAAGDRRAR